MKKSQPFSSIIMHSKGYDKPNRKFEQLAPLF